MEGNWEVNDVVYKCYVTRSLPKKILDLQRENGIVAFITIICQLITRGLSIRQHFQVTYGT